MSNSAGTRRCVSCGTDNAGGSYVSTRVGCSDAIAVDEKTRDNLGKDQICKAVSKCSSVHDYELGMPP